MCTSGSAPTCPEPFRQTVAGLGPIGWAMAGAGAQPWLACVAPFLPGVAHAVSTVVVGFPFDTVKTRVQVGLHTSPIKCAYTMVVKEGVSTLYRGAAMPLASLVVKRPCEFAAFEWCNRRFGKRAKGPLLGGFVAGVIAATLGCPFNVVKVQMQTSGKHVFRNTAEAVAEVWRTGGASGFYRGYFASLVMSVPSTTFYLGTYGILREALPPSSSSTAAAGMIASLAMWTCLLPLDNVRTRIQARPLSPGAPGSLGAAPSGAMIAVWRAEFLEVVRGPSGARGLWAGWTAVLLRAPVMSGFSMLAYERARSAAEALQR